MPNPFYLGAHYVDNFWIKDPTNYSTHKLNYDNAQLSLALSGLHNISFNSFAAMPQMDLGSMLNGFWSNAFKAANAEFAQMMMFMPQFGGGAFKMPGMATGIGPVTGGTVAETGSASLTRPAIPEDLSTENKQKFKDKCTDFETLVTKYAKLNDEQLEKLGIDKEQLELLKNNYKEATSVADLENVIINYENNFKNLSDENLMKLLKNQYKEKVLNNNLPNLTKRAIENMDGWQSIKEQTVDATTVLNGKTIIDLDTKHLSSIDEPLLIENLLKRSTKGSNDEKLQEECVRYVANLLAAEAIDSPQVANAKSKLEKALKDLYPKEKTENQEPLETRKTNLINAYKQLYTEIRIAEGVKNDKENQKTIDEEKSLPKEIKDMYYTTVDNKKVFKFTVNEDAIKEELKGFSSLKDCGLDL